jgi:hypothetical protein
MIVFGDHRSVERADDVVERVRSVMGEAAVGPSGRGARAALVELDLARTLLIECGRLEQAVLDVDPAARPVAWAAAAEASTSATDAAAARFCAIWLGTQTGSTADEPAGTASDTRAALEPLLHRVGSCLGDLRVEVTAPEGFHFYTVLPEQYLVAAQRWMEARHDGDRRVVVVGVRTIGTTLSAAVTALLRHFGWEVQRFTVRPRWPPSSTLSRPPACRRAKSRSCRATAGCRGRRRRRGSGASGTLRHGTWSGWRSCGGTARPSSNCSPNTRPS